MRRRWGFIDKQGAWTIPPIYRFTRAFANGFAECRSRPGARTYGRTETAIDFQPDEVDEAKLPDRPVGRRLRRPPSNESDQLRLVSPQRLSQSLPLMSVTRPSSS